jgi:hypothetical protein
MLRFDLQQIHQGIISGAASTDNQFLGLRGMTH